MKYLFAVDIETTGLDPNKDEITEIGAILLDKNLDRIGEPFHSFVKIGWQAKRRGLRRTIRDKKTGNKISAFELTGIDPEHAFKNARPEQVVARLGDWIYANLEQKEPLKTEDLVIFGQNTKFDEAFLKKLYIKAKITWPFDYHVIDLASIFFAYHCLLRINDFPKTLGQRNIARAVGYPWLDSQHRALPDITVSINLLKTLLGRLSLNKLI